MTEWLTDFSGQGEPTLVGHVFDMSSEVTVIISAREADTLIAARTRVGVIGGVRLQGDRNALASKNSDFFMVIGSERARYRLFPSVKHRVVRVIDLEILERRGKFPGAEGRFVAGLMMGCDYLPTGIRGYGPAKLKKLDPSLFQLATSIQGYQHATAVLHRVEPRWAALNKPNGTKIDWFAPPATGSLRTTTFTISFRATWSRSHRALREPSSTPPGSSSPVLRSMGVRTNTCLASPRPRCSRSGQPRSCKGAKAADSRRDPSSLRY